MPKICHMIAFKGWNPDVQGFEIRCRLYLVGRDFFYRGPGAQRYERIVRAKLRLDPYLRPYRNIGGLILLERIARAFQGTYAFASPVEKTVFPSEDGPFAQEGNA